MNSFVSRRVVVSELVSSRYEDGVRPQSWDLRIAGHDKIKTEEGEEITLLSDGQQSPPQKGWTILLTEDKGDGVLWTLYGLSSEAA